VIPLSEASLAAGDCWSGTGLEPVTGFLSLGRGASMIALFELWLVSRPLGTGNGLPSTSGYKQTREIIE